MFVTDHSHARDWVFNKYMGKADTQSADSNLVVDRENDLGLALFNDFCKETGNSSVNQYWLQHYWNRGYPKTCLLACFPSACLQIVRYEVFTRTRECFSFHTGNLLQAWLSKSVYSNRKYMNLNQIRNGACHLLLGMLIKWSEVKWSLDVYTQ